MEILSGSLCYYKNGPVLVTGVDKKIEITLLDGSVKKVRDKDLIFIHKGPLKSLSELSDQECDLEETWSMLEGESFSLEDLAEFLFSDDSINSVYNSFLHIKDGIYFKESGEEFICSPRGDIDAFLKKGREKEEKEQLFNSAIERLSKGRWNSEDTMVLREVEEIALEKRSNSRVLKSLKIKEDSVSAHKFLLKIGYWDIFRDPTPGRHNQTLTSSQKISEFKEVINGLDLTHLETWAIDDEGSKDPDDAISIEGDNRVWVHITDVASVIKPGSPEDIEASSRGSNLYLPTQTVHMLPEELTDFQALGLKDINNTISFLFEFDNDLNIINREIHLAQVRVKRTTYQEVEDKKESPQFKRMYEISEALRERRMKGGAISITLPEVKIRVEGESVSIKEIGYIPSRDVVSEFMMITGESAAIFASENSIPVPYATQLPPDAKGAPEDSLSSMYLWRRKFKRGETKFIAEPHAGLGLSKYTRATSPLRRYSDLIVNQQLRAFLLGEELQSEDDLLLKVTPAIEASRGLGACERESNLYWKLVYLKTNSDTLFDAIYVEKKDKGRGVFLVEALALDTLLPIPEGLELNSSIRVRVKSIDIPTQNIVFTIC